MMLWMMMVMLTMMIMVRLMMLVMFMMMVMMGTETTLRDQVGTRCKIASYK